MVVHAHHPRSGRARIRHGRTVREEDRTVVGEVFDLILDEGSRISGLFLGSVFGTTKERVGRVWIEVRRRRKGGGDDEIYLSRGDDGKARAVAAGPPDLGIEGEDTFDFFQR